MSLQALCCLLDAVEASAADAAAPAFKHKYPTAALTWPYCDHDAIVGRQLGSSSTPPPSLAGELPAWDANSRDRVAYSVFEIDVLRCGPPAPDLDSPGVCNLYGTCGEPAGTSTLAAHYALVTEERDRLESELLERWCDCLVAQVPGYSRTRTRWIEQISTSSEGRFTANKFIVHALLR